VRDEARASRRAAPPPRASRLRRSTAPMVITAVTEDPNMVAMLYDWSTSPAHRMEWGLWRDGEPSERAQVAARVEAKQKQGDAAAGLQKFQEAHNAYDEALKELPERHSTAARIHACKATVFVMEKKCAPPLSRPLLCLKPISWHVLVPSIWESAATYAVDVSTRPPGVLRF
jgi:hypothetical protein